MPESVLQWWARRQRVTGAAVPYESGRFSEFWSGYRRVLAVYEPERNHGLLLSQVPLAADVYLVFNCFLGHEWVATPQEQRDRSGRDRRGRDTTCPECSRRTLMAGPSRYGAPVGGTADAERADALRVHDERAAARRRELARSAAEAASEAGAGVWRVPASGDAAPERHAPSARGPRARESPVDPTGAARLTGRRGTAPVAGPSSPLHPAHPLGSAIRCAPVARASRFRRSRSVRSGPAVGAPRRFPGARPARPSSTRRRRGSVPRRPRASCAGASPRCSTRTSSSTPYGWRSRSTTGSTSGPT
ncbi:hypothetical protein [Arenivirga flava]|uniref:Uncharacterized protein n=1 Tax=Arenivirga flava TaxID=1930060 RepID=A0AA37UKF4_9MICO|nr:hypothetical protein [Arenivirga flava]GMA28430.1 hypothetical protein GCM10025874_16830 [Arenivirga flava]